MIKIEIPFSCFVETLKEWATDSIGEAPQKITLVRKHQEGETTSILLLNEEELVVVFEVPNFAVQMTPISQDDDLLP